MSIMENMGNGRRPRRSFSDEYKAEVVEIDAGRRPGLTTDEHAELVALRKETRVLREERDILKRATVFFAKETR
jgi:transposase